MNTYFKKICCCTSLLLLCIAGFGQSNYYKLSGGAGFGATYAYADLEEKAYSYGGYAELNWNLTLFVSAGLEVQAGRLLGGNILTNAHNREFINDYKAISFNVKGALGEVIDYSRSDLLNAIKGLYAGIGLGAIRNNLTYVVRYKPNTETQYPPLGYRFPGEEKTTNLLMPVNVGINFLINDNYGDVRYTLNLNYQTNFTFGEGLDGYNDPTGAFKNNAPDLYSLLSVGIKYHFGPSRSTKRRF